MNLTSLGPSDARRIVVLGYVVRGPMGGMAWHHLQYVMGLRDLGHEVHFLEDSGDTEYCCYDPSRNVTDTDPTFGLRFASDCFSRTGLQDRWAYFDAHANRWHGPASERSREIIRSADLLINLSASNTARPWFDEIEVRALVDTDPLFTQVRHLTDPARKALADRHNRFLTFAENIDAPDCRIPDDGYPWKPTRQPIVLDAWPVVEPPPEARFSTVMQWSSYPAVEFAGHSYGMKSDSFSDYLDLPGQVGLHFELALGGTSAPRAALRERGWVLQNPNEVAADPWSYQRFLQRSGAEFTIAKHGYVVSRSGWFSERSAAYLASGRPVVTQDTGFSAWLPTGEGLLSFSTPDEAGAACREVLRAGETHRRAARALAEEHFGAEKVLRRLLADVWGPVPE
ncbi:MAG: hypothetical protein AMS19_10720 [Gemmatimonas sp. SG8_23]|nr:MAG: hypothetical protein AMS19_10720 [Gemmatimonas sp. SG8_23]